MSGSTPAAERYRQSLRKAKNLFQTRPRLFRLRQWWVGFTGLLPNKHYAVPVMIVTGFSMVSVFSAGRSVPKAIAIIAGTLIGVLLIYSVVNLVVRHRKANINHEAGIELTQQDAPELFKVVAETRRGLGAPKTHKVQIGFGNTASIEILPRFGPLGPTRRRLILGMPMLAAISTDQARAVIAHEVAHTLSAAPSTPPWIEWVIMHWRGHLDRNNRRIDDSAEIDFFIKLSSMRDACSQSTERFADRRAADLCGANNMIDALLRITLMDTYGSDVYWPRLRRMQGHRALPPDTAYSAFTAELSSGCADENASERIERELLQGTMEDDTHPSLLDRLRALGWDQADSIDPQTDRNTEIQPPGKPEISAWDAWFTPASKVRLAAVLDRIYQESSIQAWQAEHHRTQASQDALRQDREIITHFGQAIRTVPETQIPQDATGVLCAPLSAETADLTRTADLLGYAVPPDVAKPLLSGLLAINPDLPHAHYHLGRLMLEEKDPACLAHLEKACELSPILAGQARQNAYLFLRSIGRIEEAEKMRLDADIAFQKYRQFHEKLTMFPERARLSEHGLTPLDLLRLTRRLASYTVIAKAYLFKRDDLVIGDQVGHALCIQLKTKWYKYQSDAYMQRAEAALGSVFDLCVPNAVWVLNREALKAIRVRVRKRQEAVIYQA